MRPSPKAWTGLSRKRWPKNGQTGISPRKRWPATWRRWPITPASLSRGNGRGCAPRQPGPGIWLSARPRAGPSPKAFAQLTEAISPEGERVVFWSKRAGGGIFVMGATGENVRRLTNFGYNPSWSPDGKEIVCSTGFFVRPEVQTDLPPTALYTR
jgi:hypothetical protein